jgi:hypothetical protein
LFHWHINKNIFKKIYISSRIFKYWRNTRVRRVWRKLENTSGTIVCFLTEIRIGCRSNMAKECYPLPHRLWSCEAANITNPCELGLLKGHFLIKVLCLVVSIAKSKHSGITLVSGFTKAYRPSIPIWSTHTIESRYSPHSAFFISLRVHLLRTKYLLN